MVATFRDNEIKPMLFPEMIAKVCKQYDNAHILVEVNDIGAQISDGLHFEIEYPNVLMTTQKGRAGQILGAMFSQRGSQLGVRMTKQVKKMGTANIKSIIESDKLIINDFNIIEEMSTYTRKNQSWQAEEGCNDDYMTCLVILGWVANQRFFKEMTDRNIRAEMYKEQEKLIEQDMAPFGFVDDGITKEEDKPTVDEYGTVWHPVVRKGQ